MFHLTLRVAWHDARWNGIVYREPSHNSFCIALDRIRLERNDVAEDGFAGRSWNDLTPEQHPPCKTESGIFMSLHEWTRRFNHPYAEINKAVYDETGDGVRGDRNVLTIES